MLINERRKKYLRERYLGNIQYCILFRLHGHFCKCDLDALSYGEYCDYLDENAHETPEEVQESVTNSIVKSLQRYTTERSATA